MNWFRGEVGTSRDAGVRDCNRARPLGTRAITEYLGLRNTWVTPHSLLRDFPFPPGFQRQMEQWGQ